MFIQIIYFSSSFQTQTTVSNISFIIKVKSLWNHIISTNRFLLTNVSGASQITTYSSNNCQIVNNNIKGCYVCYDKFHNPHYIFH